MSGSSPAIPPQAAAERLPELDSLRGLAATAVLIFHVMRVIVGGSYRVSENQFVYILSAHTPLRSFFFGRAPVLFFFVLSGFVLTRSLLRHGSPGLLTFAV